MMKRIKILIATLTVFAAISGAVVPALAASPGVPHGVTFGASFKSDACSGISTLGGGGCGGGGGTSIGHVMKVAIQLFSIVVGFAAVLVIIISGLRFITSGGDPANVAKARSGVLYALVGLVLVALSQTIVHFVLGKIK
jgi:hypothetical protein